MAAALDAITHAASEETAPADRDGRTTTQLDDWLTRTAGRLSPMAALAVAGVIYATLGLAFPLTLNVSRPALIGWNAIGVMLGLAVVLAAVFSAQQATHRRSLLEWTSDLRKLTTTEFEWLVGELLRREGYTVRETGRPDSADGNVDLRARKDEHLSLVQCKRWTATVVGVDEVRKLAGTVAAEHAPGCRGVLVTLSKFSHDAIHEAARTNLELIDNVALHTRIERARRTEPCPRCSTPMLLDRSNRGWWLRCPNWPKCDGKRNLTNDPGAAVDLLLTQT